MKRRVWYLRGAWWRKIRLNYKYKDRLFRFLFRNKKDLLDLYNALNHTNYTNPDELEIVTMEDVIFMKMKNDLSFIVSGRLCLYEQQSTYNPNMPLRGLFYLAQQYEGLVASRGDNLYGTMKIKLPTPEFVVFYNGTQKTDDRETLYLSDSFQNGRGSGCLECRCEMYNINRGHNKDILDRCKRLWEYSEFVAEIDDNLYKGLALAEALQLAIDRCIERGILKDILVREKEEVQHMILTEFNERRYKKALFAEGREDGYRVGREEGFTDGHEEGREKGRAEGREEGLAEGREEGLAEGREEGIRVLIETCEELGLSRDDIEHQISKKYSVSVRESQKYMECYADSSKK